MYLFRCDGCLRNLPQFLYRLLVIAKILFTANEDDGETLTEVQHLGDPL